MRIVVFFEPSGGSKHVFYQRASLGGGHARSGALRGVLALPERALRPLRACDVRELRDDPDSVGMWPLRIVAG